MWFTEITSAGYEKHKKHIKTKHVETHSLNCRNEWSFTKTTVLKKKGQLH